MAGVGAELGSLRKLPYPQIFLSFYALFQDQIFGFREDVVLGSGGS